MDYRIAILAVGLMLVVFASNAQEKTSSQRPLENGKTVYDTYCLSCHQSDGSGIPNLAPPLVKGEYVNGEKDRLIDIVLKGMEGVTIKGETYFNPMPPFDYLSDQEIADVLTYIRANFENSGSAVVADEVKARREFN